jgi:hypothetical protein
MLIAAARTFSIYQTGIDQIDSGIAPRGGKKVLKQ